jgi:hypothetical protein
VSDQDGLVLPLDRSDVPPAITSRPPGFLGAEYAAGCVQAMRKSPRVARSSPPWWRCTSPHLRKWCRGGPLALRGDGGGVNQSPAHHPGAPLKNDPPGPPPSTAPDAAGPSAIAHARDRDPNHYLATVHSGGDRRRDTVLRRCNERWEGLLMASSRGSRLTHGGESEKIR